MIPNAEIMPRALIRVSMSSAPHKINLVHMKGFKNCIQPSTIERHSERITRLTHRSQSLQSRPNKAIVISAMRKFIETFMYSDRILHIHDCMSIEDDSTVHLESTTVELLG